MTARAARELTRHYDAKYAGEANPGDTRQVRATAWPANRYEACVSLVPRLFRGERILELAAGSGLVARSLLAEGLACERYVASECSESRLAGLARTLSDPRVEVMALDAEALPASAHGAYDAILMVALIEHLVDPLRAMSRVRECLRPGGFVYLDTPNIAKLSRRLKLLAGHFPSTASRDEGLVTYDGGPVDLHDEGHLHYFTYRSLERMLVSRCGFRRTQRFGYALGGGPHHRIRGAVARRFPSLFSEICLVAWV